MVRSVRSGFLSLMGAVLFAGCGKPIGTPPTDPLDSSAALASHEVQHLTTAGRVATDDKADRGIVREDAEIILQLDVYQLTVPFGAISSNARFWNHVDEDHIDLATHDLLLKNGLRVGIGPNNEWTYFKDLVERFGASAQKGSTSPVKKGMLELPLRTNIETQDIFYLNSRNALYGRTYDKCDNVISLSYEPTPRHPGNARIEACALVRGLRKHFEVTVLNEEREIELRRPEYLYDLRLSQDVPMDHFLVIAPSSQATFPDNLGHTFFVKPGVTTPLETVLLLVPRPFRITGQAPAIELPRIAPCAKAWHNQYNG